MGMTGVFRAGSPRSLWHHRGVRWLAGLTLALAVIFAGASTSEAQVFKPRGGSKGKTAKKAAPKKGGTVAAKKPTAKNGKKSKVASKGRPSDLTPDKDNLSEEDDYVEIIDDDE